MGSLGTGGGENKESSAENYSTELKQYLGTEYVGLKGKVAVDKILKEQQGHVKDAFQRDDIGGVTIAWGDNKSGIKHIISSREKRQQGWQDVLHELSDVVESGELRIDKGKFIIEKNKKKSEDVRRISD